MQRWATKLVESVKDLHYDERLKIVGLMQRCSLGLNVLISRPTNALASVSSWMDWRTPQFWSQSLNRGSPSWCHSQTVRPWAHPWWPQPSVLFAQLNSLPCHRPLYYCLYYSFNQHTIVKSINLQASIDIILFVYYQLISATFINIWRK